MLDKFFSEHEIHAITSKDSIKDFNEMNFHEVNSSRLKKDKCLLTDGPGNIQSSNRPIIGKGMEEIPPMVSGSILEHPPLFPQSDKNESDKSRSNSTAIINKLRKDNIDLRGRLKERCEANNKIEFEKGKLLDDLNVTKGKFEDIVNTLETILNNDVMSDSSKEMIDCLIQKYKD